MAMAPPGPLTKQRGHQVNITQATAQCVSRGGEARDNNTMFSRPHFKAAYSKGNSVTERAEERKSEAQKSCLFCLLTPVESASALKLTYK